MPRAPTQLNPPPTVRKGQCERVFCQMERGCSVGHQSTPPDGCQCQSPGPLLHAQWKIPVSTYPTSSADELLKHRDTVIRAARAVDPGVAGLEARMSWWWTKIHAIPVARYLGKGTNGTEALREEIEAENDGIKIPSRVWWLSGMPSVKARFKEGSIKPSSVVLAVSDEDTFRLVCKGGLRLQGAGTTLRPTKK